jgi:hypothetical protein
MSDELTRTFSQALDELPDEIPGAGNLDPGRISWLHGTNQAGAKAPGCFYGKDTAFTEPPAAPWVADERYADQGELGYSATELRIAILGWRDQWFLPGEDRGDLPTWLPTYEAGAKKLTEYLIMVDGLGDPMVLSVSGKYKAGPFAKIFSDYRRGSLAQAMRKIKRTLPPWSHWLTIAGKKDASSKPIYEKATDGDGKEYGSIVTVPTLIAPPQEVTIETLKEGIFLYQQYQAAGWFSYRRTPRDVVEGQVVSSAPQLAAPRNAPQPIETDADLPF